MPAFIRICCCFTFYFFCNMNLQKYVLIILFFQISNGKVWYHFLPIFLFSNKYAIPVLFTIIYFSKYTSLANQLIIGLRISNLIHPAKSPRRYLLSVWLPLIILSLWQYPDQSRNPGNLFVLK